LTTTSGKTNEPIGVSFSMAPVMPTTITHSTSTASRSAPTAARARAVPIPEVTAITSLSPIRPT
jgi:hypothetical protein